MWKRQRPHGGRKNPARDGEGKAGAGLAGDEFADDIEGCHLMQGRPFDAVLCHGPMKGARDVILTERRDERKVDASRAKQPGERPDLAVAMDEEFHGQAHEELGFAARRGGSFEHGDGEVDLAFGEPLVDLAAQSFPHHTGEMGKLRAERFEQAGKMGAEHDAGSADPEDFEIGGLQPGDDQGELLEERLNEREEAPAGGGR